MKKNNNQKNEFNNPAKSSPNVKEITKEKKPQRKAEKKIKRMKRNSTIFVILHGLLSVLFLGTMFTLGLLPLSYTMIVMLVVILLFGITWLTQKRKKTGRILGRIYSLFVMIILLSASLVMGVANYVLDEITGAPYETKSEGFDLMSLGSVFSISEDPFCVYVQNMEGGIDLKDADDARVLLSVNTQTHQVFGAVTPGDFFVTIPGVTNGQKELLKSAEEHGIEASVSALGSLYEANISYYLKADTEWLKNWKSLSLPELSDGILNIGEHVQTNMKKSEVRQLIKMQITKPATWKIQTVTADGTVSSSYTFSSPKKAVYGLAPNSETVKDIIKWINRMEEGEIIRDVNPIELD